MTKRVVKTTFYRIDMEDFCAFLGLPKGTKLQLNKKYSSGNQLFELGATVSEVLEDNTPAPVEPAAQDV